jgi:anti-sigma factor RsiW
MNAQRFEQLALAYGADITRWPAAEQAAAQQWAADDSGAQLLLAHAAQLDGLLRDAAPAVGDAAAARVVQRSLERTSRPQPPRRWWWWRAGPAALLVGAALAGCAAARERPQWIGLPQAEPARSALADAFDADGSRF